jgi:hypothetical protein
MKQAPQECLRSGRVFVTCDAGESTLECVCACAVRMWFYTLPTIHIGTVVRRCAGDSKSTRTIWNRPKKRSSAETPIDCSIHYSRDRQPLELGMSMRGKAVTTFCSGLLVFFFVCLIGGAGAQVESFYRGKTITIVVGYNPGDAHDLWARAYSRTMGRYIPGNPNVIVRNMPGGGTMIAANYVYGVAEPDGATLGSIFPSLYFAQLSGRKEVKFDWGKLNITVAFFTCGPTHNTRLWRTFEKRQNHRSARPPQWALPVTTFLSSWRRL